MTQEHKTLKSSWIESPLGQILAIADDEKLFLLEFADRQILKKEIDKLRLKTKSTIAPGRTKPIESIEKELKSYFAGRIRHFETPIHLLGTPFQISVWEELKKIPTGETRSYAEIAVAIGKPTAFRAVALANGANQLAIIVPCHRVINSDGRLGGYGGGISRKEWLLNLEKPK